MMIIPDEQVCVAADPFEFVSWRALAPRRAAAGLASVAGWSAEAMTIRAAAEAGASDG